MKVLSCLTLVVFYFISNFICSVFNFFNANGYMPNYISLILTIISSIVIAILALYISEKLFSSINGNRYKVVSIIAIVIGFITAIGMLKTVHEDSELFTMFIKPEELFTFLVSLLNPTFIFGVTLFILYKKNYNKKTKNLHV